MRALVARALPWKMPSQAQRPAAGRTTDRARVMLHLYMQASTLAGLDDQPATLLGYGPIEAGQARRLAENAAVNSNPDRSLQRRDQSR